jgi:hypothetical protein
MYIFGESCSSCYTEHRKIEFAIFGVFYDLKSILQVSAEIHKRIRINLLETPRLFGTSQFYPCF